MGAKPNHHAASPSEARRQTRVLSTFLKNGCNWGLTLIGTKTHVKRF